MILRNLAYISTLSILYMLPISIKCQLYETAILAYSENELTTNYKLIHSTWLAFEDISYISPLPYITSNGKRKIELRNIEKSKTDFQFLEGMLNLKYPILMGRSSSKGFLRRTRLNIIYKPNFRMYINPTASNSVTPTNQEIGLSLDLNLYEKNSGKYWKDCKRYNEYFRSTKSRDTVTCDSNIKQPRKLLDSIGNSFFVNLYIQSAHYSNGQTNGSFYYENNKYRNDYSKGDFSTNYIKGTISIGNYYYSIQNDPKINTHLMWQLGLSYQHDGDWPGGYTDSLIGSYGKERIQLKFDFRNGPMLSNNIFQKRAPTHTIKYHSERGDKLNVNRLIEHHFYVKTTLITDKLYNFKPNLENQSSQFRMNFEFVYEACYYRFRSINFFAKYYFGRDYLNIRFDDIVHIAMIGITATPFKYRQPFWQTKDAYYPDK